MPEILAHAYAHGGGTVLIDGLAGMGKTHFLRTLAIEAERQNRWPVTFVSADRFETGEPYSFIERFLAAGIAPEWNFAPDAQLQPIAVARECIRRLLCDTREPDEGRIIIVDDAHWIDPASVHVLRHMIPRFNRRNVLIACAARTPHKIGSLGELLTQAAAMNPHDQHIEMSPLTEHDIRALAVQRFGVTISMRNARQLNEITGGSFHGVQSIFDYVTDDEIQRLHTAWDLPMRSQNFENPLLGAYLELSTPAQQTAQIVCLAEHEISPHTLQAVAGRLGVPVTLDEAIRAGVVMEADFGQSVLPRHHLLGAAVRSSIQPAVRRRIHQLLAEYTDGFQAVRHALNGAQTLQPELYRHVVQCAREATEQAAFTKANDILRMALNLTSTEVDRRELITELVLINIRAKTGFKCLDVLPELETFPPTMLREFLIVMLRVYLVDEPFPAHRVHRVLTRTDVTPDEQTLQAFLLFVMIATRMRTADRSEIRQLIDQAKELFATCPTHPEQLTDARLAWMVSPYEYRLLLDCFAVVQLHLDGDIPATRAALPELLDRVADLPDITLKVDCLAPLAGAAMAVGDLILAHDIAAQAVDLLERLKVEPWTAATPRIILAHTLGLLGKYRQAEQVLDRLDEFSHDALDYEARLTGAALRAFMAAVRNLRDPKQYLAHARRLADLDWEHYGRDLAVVAKAEIARVAQEPTEILAAVSRHNTAAFRNTQRGFLTYKAHAFITLGAHDDARRLISELASRRGKTWFEYWGTLDWLEARLAQANDDHILAQHKYASALKHRLFPLPWALTALDFGTFLLANGRLDEAETMLREAVSVLEKVGAAAYVQRGKQLLKSAVQESSNSHADAFAAMTNREREVATLLAEGYSNKTIAERLVVSESTARFHVSNILRKLQLNSRAEVPRMVKQSLGSS